MASGRGEGRPWTGSAVKLGAVAIALVPLVSREDAVAVARAET